MNGSKPFAGLSNHEKLEALRIVAVAAKERLEAQLQQERDHQLRDIAHLELAITLGHVKTELGMTWEGLGNALGCPIGTEMLKSIGLRRSSPSDRNFAKLRIALVKLCKSHSLSIPTISLPPSLKS